MIWIIIPVIGFIFAFITPLTHVLGFILLYQSKTKLVNQRMILMNFSIFAIVALTVYNIRGIYSYIYKNNNYRLAKYFLHTNGMFIGAGLYYTLLLFVLTVDRLIITIKPLTYSKTFSKKSCIIALATLGTLVAAISVTFIAYLNRDIHILSYIAVLVTTGSLSLFNLVSYIFIYLKINKQLKKAASRMSVKKHRRNRRKILVPLMINLSLLVFFFLPHTVIMVFRNELGYMKVAIVGMTYSNIGLFADALIYILNTNTRKVLARKLDKIGFTFLNSINDEAVGLTESKHCVNRNSVENINRV